MPANLDELCTVKLTDLMGLEFTIPYYQRGYKWRKEDIELLVNDIKDYQEEHPYYLQPLVVIKTGEKSFLLVDGQQRLTTIYLILKKAHQAKDCNHIRDKLYDFACESKCESEDYLKNYPNKWNGKETCDIHYYEEARNCIEGIKVEDLQKFTDKLQHNVEFIWYPLENKEEGPAHFERLNSCKIPLSNTELTKALLLQHASKDDRILRATEWNQMEYTLQDDAFFAFLCPLKGHYGTIPNRIELLLDIYAENLSQKNTDKDMRKTYKEIERRLNKQNDNVWTDLVNLFHTLESWYQNPFCYNLIGFLTEVNGADILGKLYTDDKKKCLRKFELELLKRICKYITTKKEDIRPEIENLTYKDQKTKHILLLFNILQMMSTPLPENNTPWREGSTPLPDEYFRFNDRFHFELYKSEGKGWDVEHVHATASESLTDKDEWIEWMLDVAPDLDHIPESELHHSESDGHPGAKKYIDQIKQFADKIKETTDEKKRQDLKEAERESYNKEGFAEMYNCIVKALEMHAPDRDELEQNSIGNLALLNASINRAYKAAPFSTKRRHIIERIKHGTFVPVATRNLFLKLYTSHPDELYHWRKEKYPNGEPSDSQQYINTMIETFEQIFPDTTEKL